MAQTIDLTKPIEAQCYYVKEEAHGWWGYFTITSALGLLQIHSDWGDYTYRWNAFRGGFKEFLIRITDDYVGDALLSCGNGTARTQNLVQHLWPLFIEKLLAERAAGNPTQGEHQP